MAFDRIPAIRTELAFGGGDRTLGDEEETIVAERTVPGDRRLEEMAVAVQLVAPRQVAVFGAWSQDLDEGVDVPVGPLRGGHQVDGLVRHRADPVVPLATQLPPGGFEPLVDVRVQERERLVEHQAERPVPLTPIRRAGGQLEVVERSRASQLLETGGDRALAVRLQPVRPEPAGDADIRAGDGPEASRARRRMAETAVTSPAAPASTPMAAVRGSRTPGSSAARV